MKLLSSFFLLAMVTTMSATTLDFNTPGQFNDFFHAGTFVQTDSGGIDGSGAILPSTAIYEGGYNGENGLIDPIQHTPGTPIEITVFFKYDASQVIPNKKSPAAGLLLSGDDDAEFTVFHSGLGNGTFHYEIGTETVRSSTTLTTNLVDGHWYKVGLRMSALDANGIVNIQGFLQDFGTSGTVPGAILVNTLMPVYAPEIRMDVDFAPFVTAFAEAGTALLDNFTFNDTLSALPTPTFETEFVGPEISASILVYNFTYNGSTTYAGKKTPFKRAGYAVLDLDNNLATVISTFQDRDGKHYISESRDNTTWFNVQFSKKGEYTVISSLENNAASPDTNFSFISVKGVNTKLNVGDIVMPKAMTGISRVKSSDDAYLEEGNVKMTFNKADTVKAFNEELDRDGVVAVLVERLEEKGFNAY